jgi:hypothetical protein
VAAVRAEVTLNFALAGFPQAVLETSLAAAFRASRIWALRIAIKIVL